MVSSLPPTRRSGLLSRGLTIGIYCALLAAGSPVLAQNAPPPDAASGTANARIPNDQLDSLVAPIALYPDPLLAQVLAASTYPLELVQLEQWLGQHQDLKDKALADAVAQQGWDPSVQGLAGLPDVVKRLSDDIKWTTDLGNAFLAQQSDVMDAVQRMRAKAQSQGSLKSSPQVNVQSQTADNKQVIVIEQANPQVVYVPTYNPTVVYGAPIYPYPPIYYPPPPPPGAYAAGLAISFGVGVAMGAMWSGGWGYHCGWGGSNNVVINNNNTFIHNTNINNRTNINSANINNNTWQHNPQHRGGAPYGNQTVASRYGGTTANSSLAQRQASAQRNISSERASGQQFGGSNRVGGGGGTQAPGGLGGGSSRIGGAGGTQAGGGLGGGTGGGDHVGGRNLSSSGAGSRGGGAFGAGGGGVSGHSAFASGSRGASSFGGGFHGGGRRR
jgi:Protein of unknown function (DUF3300)